MNLIDSALKAFSKSDLVLFEKYIDNFTKEQIQELANKISVCNASVMMSGSWVEEGSVDLVHYDATIVQKKVAYEQGFQGTLEQSFGFDKLDQAAIFSLNDCIDEEFDEDYFEIGTMLLDVYSADEVYLQAECRYESRQIRYDEIEDEDFDENSCDVEYGLYPIALNSTAITANRIILNINKGNAVTLPLKGSSYRLKWFLFSVLFMSSGKSFIDISHARFEIAQFMENYFDIKVPEEFLSSPAI